MTNLEATIAFQAFIIASTVAVIALAIIGNYLGWWD